MHWAKPKLETRKPNGRAPRRVDSRRARRGVTILEVLFAILVTTIGLFGALALLPVASTQARKGRVNDAVAVLGVNAIHDFDGRGMRSVANWRAWNQATSVYQQYAPVFGESICIDPRMLAANGVAGANAASIFPYEPRAIVTDPRMRRVTLQNGGGLPMSNLVADSIFQFNDDLTYERSDDQSLVASQQWAAMPGGAARRQTDGHISWLATLCPKVDRYSVTTSGEYVLSVVLFYDRPADMAVGDALNERVLSVTMPGGGITGGEVLLQATTEAALAIKTGSWMMLAGRSREYDLNPDPSIVQLSQPVPQFRWYRVSDLEAEVSPAGANFERYVTLMGTDWDLDTTNQQAVIVEGVVGVYEKTIKLE